MLRGNRWESDTVPLLYGGGAAHGTLERYPLWEVAQLPDELQVRILGVQTTHGVQRSIGQRCFFIPFFGFIQMRLPTSGQAGGQGIGSVGVLLLPGGTRPGGE